MDFLRTLLAYMATTLVVAVESTATPTVTPVPTPTPTPEVTAAVVEMVTDTPTPAATDTPEPTVSVTPEPVPTITANAKAYHNLSQGDKGDEVRRLQEKLIELGYLPEGAADGAYGNQTRMAVRRFQYYNSLAVDGIAGRATQTNLFENPDIVPYPAQETPTPEVTATPTPKATPVPTVTPYVVEATVAVTAEAATVAPTAEMAEETEPTEAPTDEETAEPEEETKPAEETGEEPAEQTAEDTTEPTEETTAEPTEESTETDEPASETAALAAEQTGTAVTTEPEDTAESAIEGAQAEATEEPEAASTPQAAVTEVVEDVDLDEAEATPTPAPTEEPRKLDYQDLAGWIVLNDSGESMQWTELEDGVPVVRSPRLQQAEEDIRVSLDDLCKSVDTWTLTEEDHALILEADGYTLALLNEDAGFVSMIDGMEMFTESGDFEFEEGHFIRVNFLTRALDGSWEWDAEEETLMLRIPPKNSTQYTD